MRIMRFYSIDPYITNKVLYTNKLHEGN